MNKTRYSATEFGRNKPMNFRPSGTLTFLTYGRILLISLEKLFGHIRVNTQKIKENLPSGRGIMFIPSCKILKILTWQDRQLRKCRNCDATLGTRFQVCLFQLYFLGRFFRPDDLLSVWKGDVLGGSVLVEEHYIIRFQIIGSLAPNIAECFRPCADWFFLKWIHRHFVQNGD